MFIVFTLFVGLVTNLYVSTYLDPRIQDSYISLSLLSEDSIKDFAIAASVNNPTGYIVSGIDNQFYDRYYNVNYESKIYTSSRSWFSINTGITPLRKGYTISYSNAASESTAPMNKDIYFNNDGTIYLKKGWVFVGNNNYNLESYFHEKTNETKTGIAGFFDAIIGPNSITAKFLTKITAESTIEPYLLFGMSAISFSGQDYASMLTRKVFFTYGYGVNLLQGQNNRWGLFIEQRFGHLYMVTDDFSPDRLKYYDRSIYLGIKYKFLSSSDIATSEQYKVYIEKLLLEEENKKSKFNNIIFAQDALEYSNDGAKTNKKIKKRMKKDGLNPEQFDIDRQAILAEEIRKLPVAKRGPYYQRLKPQFKDADLEYLLYLKEEKAKKKAPAIEEQISDDELLQLLDTSENKEK